MATELGRVEPRYRRLAKEERRAQIIAAARRLFSQRSFSSVSSAEIAAAAGINRGLLHHYFGTKRDLYLEVVQDMVRVPPPLALADLREHSVDEILARFLDDWLTMVWRNRGTWFAALGGEGFGRDRDVEKILDRAREAMVDRILEALAPGDPEPSSQVLRAMVRSWIGLADASTWEWLVRRRLTRGQVRVLLLESARSLRAILPDVIEAGAEEDAAASAR